ncbi:hypothetical protein BT69DRAFT_678553 [Atractiella rhizophila]|nr:hypothetical protein BT69DRAFT_678553 [Atractiella rhizophila]
MSTYSLVPSPTPSLRHISRLNLHPSAFKRHKIATGDLIYLFPTSTSALENDFDKLHIGPHSKHQSDGQDSEKKQTKIVVIGTAWPSYDLQEHG